MKLAAAFVIVGLSLAACSSDSKSSDSTSANSTTPEAVTTDPAGTTGTPAGDATVVLADSDLGEILTTADGMTLYLYTPDSATASACTGGCASAWPPLAGPAVGGEGLDAAAFGTVTRDDGSVQATYQGHPLYTFGGDAAPGDVNGQGASDVWYALTADGSQASAGVKGY